MAALEPASGAPMKSQFFLPTAVGRIAFSTWLCRLPNYADLMVAAAEFPKELLKCSLHDAA